VPPPRWRCQAGALRGAAETTPEQRARHAAQAARPACQRRRFRHAAETTGTVSIMEAERTAVRLILEIILSRPGSVP